MNREIIRNCIPSIIALTLTGLYSIIDGLFIGNVIGENGLAAINVAWPIPALVTAIGTGIGTGGCIFYSIQIGRKHSVLAGRGLTVTFLTLLAAGILSTVVLLPFSRMILIWLGAEGKVFCLAFDYAKVFLAGSAFSVMGAGMVPILRGIGYAPSAMWITIIGMLGNLLADYLLIAKWKHGIVGAAFGSVLAQSIVCLLGAVCLVLYRKKQGCLMYKTNTGKEYRAILVRILQSGLAAFGGSISATVVLIFTNWQCLRYGSTPAVAAYAAISYITFPVQYLLQGVGEGMLPLVSYAYGAGNQEKLVVLRKKALCLIGCMGVCLFGIVQIFSSQLSHCFGLSGVGKTLFLEGIRISSIAFLLMGYVKWNISYCNAVSRVGNAVLLTYGESFLAAPVLLFLLPNWFGMKGIWLAFVGTTVMMLFVYHFLQRKANKKGLLWR